MSTSDKDRKRYWLTLSEADENLLDEFIADVAAKTGCYIPKTQVLHDMAIRGLQDSMKK